MRLMVGIMAAAVVVGGAAAGGGNYPSPEHPTGWRGNWTGVYPDARPPLEWHRLLKTPLKDLRVSARKPKSDADGELTGSSDGYVNHWLVLGPIPAPDPDKALDQAFIGDETKLKPDEGQKVTAAGAGEIEWKAQAIYDNHEKGNYESARLSLFPGKTDHVAYAHTYIYSPADQTIRAGARNDGTAFKIVVNGQALHKPDSKQPFVLPLTRGWNSVLMKCVKGRDNPKEWNAHLRLSRPAATEYDTRNILWMTKIATPRQVQENASTPVVVGDKIFITAEPGDVICINRADGKILWIRSNNFYEIATDEEKAGVKEKLEPIRTKLNEENEAVIKALNEIPPAEHMIGLAAAKAGPLNNLLEQKFKTEQQIIGAMHSANKKYEVPRQTNRCCNHTCISDGKYVWAQFGYGVVACYDLGGKAIWKVFVDGMGWEHHGNHGSPAMSNGKLILRCGPAEGPYAMGVACLDAFTGKQLWRVKNVHCRDASLLIGKVGDETFFTGYDGAGFSMTDGRRLWAGQEWQGAGAVGSSSAVIDKGMWYFHDSDRLTIAKLPDKPDGKLQVLFRTPYNVGMPYKGFPISSPVVYNGLVFGLEHFGTLQIWDAKDGSLIADRRLNMRNRSGSRVTVGASASVAVANNRLYLLDNAGIAMALEPAREAKILARNVLEHYLGGGGQGEPEQTVAWAFDGRNIFIRGTEYLYCIGEK